MRIILLIVSIFIVGCTQSSPTTPIQPDPNWTQGQLDNGVKYHIYPTDKEPVSLRLYVHIGSAHETEQQKGYAHFLEHMAFNGSTNFTSNDVVKMFESAGLSFGADINAYTSYYETVYQLDLPDNAQLENAMMWMRDIADGLTISDAEVAKEIGVIKGEIRRNRPENKGFSERYYDHLIQGTKLEHIDPVGTVESVSNTTSDSLRAFYQQWYHPQFAEIIVTGDVDAKAAQQLIEQKFANWTAAKTAPDNTVEKPRLTLTDYVDTVGQYDMPSLTLMSTRGPSLYTSREKQIEDWFDNLALELINRKLNAAFDDAAVPVQELVAASIDMDKNNVALYSVSFSPEQRETAEQLLIATLATLRDYGVTENDIQASIAANKQQLTDLDYDWSQQDAPDYAEAKSYSISTGEINQSKQDYRAALTQFVDSITLDKVNAQIHSLLSDEFVVLRAAENEQAIASLSAEIPALKAKLAEKGAKPIALAAGDNQLAGPQASGQVVAQKTNELGFHVWTLSNGVEVWLETDPTTEEHVSVIYASQGGYAALTPNLFAAADLSVPVVIKSGVGGYNGSDFDSYLTRNSIRVFPFVSSTHHGVELALTKEKLADAFKVIFNITTNINVDQRQLDKVRQENIQQQSNYLATPHGKWTQAANRNIFSPESRKYNQSAPALSMVTPEDIRAVHHELFGKNRGNKFVIVGDLTPAEVTPLLRHYIASIPLDEASAPSYKVAYNPEPKALVTVAENNEQNTLYTVSVINSDASAGTARTAFIDDMLQRVLSKRLNEYVREELGLDYAPDAYSVSRDQEPATDWVVDAQVAPKDIDKIDKAIDTVLADLAKGVTQQELDIAAKQLTVALHPLKENPVERTWFYTRYLIHGYGVEALKDVDAMADSITLEEFNQRVTEAFGAGTVKTKYRLTPAQ
ncbi:M16 family metallopeptidase [Vibrio hepatarius]|uniref:Peptidase M16 n=1 Tax=Vibrio hepatarius TaxID=171383 RepID=A0A0M0I499_9VIBR|nr:insulinase family protein [Vibrio hepatarius]KOO09124.1 peptidase M16 [Vibrio hepatarius]